MKVAISSNPQATTNTYGSWTRPDIDMSLYDATNQSALQNVITNPYFIQALASIGEGLDPQGVGGALGRQAKGAVSSRQAARANERAIADTNARHKELIRALGYHGGMTPKGTPGPSSASMGADGSMTIKIDPQTPVEIKPPPSASNRDTQTSVPLGSMATIKTTQGYDASAPSPMELAPPEAVRKQQLGPVPATAIGPTRSQSYNNLTDIIPFYQAPLRSQRRR
jgi:hypothetical protein